jgi:MFS transporter, SP family, solute carrier family 2 (facilitated glucose transporter), member 1
LTNWIFTFVIGLTFPSIKDAVGIYSTFFGFACFCVLGGVLFVFFLKETFGLNKDQI